MEGVEQSKVKYTHSRDTVNIDLEINNEKQDCNIGTVYVRVLVGGGGGMKEIRVRKYS
jgi:hypothetical protein